MKVFVGAVMAVVVIATASQLILTSTFRESAETAFSTTTARP